MKKSSMKRKMIWILAFFIAFIAAVVLFFQIPYSVTSNSFQRDVQRHIEQSTMQAGVFTEEDIAHLPEAVQNHFRAAGMIGQPIMSRVSIHVPSAHITQSRDSTPLVLDYSFYLFGHSPVRLAYMNTSMFGIPFEGFDSFQYGEGFMRGVIAKVFTLFHQTGPEMDKGQLLTYLAEVFFIPSAIFSDYISWEAIDANHVRATITYGELSGSGIFTFDENGFAQSFRTAERARIKTDGSIDFPEWSGVFEGWIQGESGIYLPSNFKAIWHEPEGDLIYFKPTSGFDIVFH